MRADGPLLSVRDLTVELRQGRGSPVPVVEGLSFDLEPGGSLGMVGESGTGKSVTILALAGLLPPPLAIGQASKIVWKGRDLTASADGWAGLRGPAVGVLFQDPGRSLDPVFPVGPQVAEVAAAHRDLTSEEARRRATGLLERAGLSDAADRYRAYPHELSGGEQQRVALAAALAAEPQLLLADEPTSALDAPVAAGVLDLLAELRRERGTALLMVSHDLRAVARAARRVAVLYAGRLVEEGPTRRVLRRPLHPYSRALLAAVPRGGGDGDTGGRLEALPGRVPSPGARPAGCRFRPRCPHGWTRCRTEPPLLEEDGSRARCWLLEEPGRRNERAGEPAGGAAGAPAGAPRRGGAPDGAPAGVDGPLLEARGAVRRFRTGETGRGTGRGTGAARPERGSVGVHGLDLELRAGESMGLVGRSGSGKSTAARLLLRLDRPQAGEVRFRGRDVWTLEGPDLMSYRRTVQPVFQNPTGSLNPRLRVGAAVREPLEVHGLARGDEARRRALEALDRVGLDPAMASRYPHELSGGECQRAALARALVLGPRLLVADEPTSALDVSVQAAILNLLAGLREEFGLGLLFISHDLAVVRHLCTRVAVMADGRVVERGPTERIFRCPEDERTRALVEPAYEGIAAT